MRHKAKKIEFEIPAGRVEAFNNSKAGTEAAENIKLSDAQFVSQIIQSFIEIPSDQSAGNRFLSNAITAMYALEFAVEVLNATADKKQVCYSDEQIKIIAEELLSMSSRISGMYQRIVDSGGGQLQPENKEPTKESIYVTKRPH